MRASETSKQGKAVTPLESLERLKKQTNFEAWPLKEHQFLPGFSPKTTSLLSAKEYALERERLLPVISSCTARAYFYAQVQSRSAFELTVLVGHKSARDAAEALLLQIVYTQMHSEPRVVSAGSPLGEVTIYLHPDLKQSVAFVRNNVALSIQNYSSGPAQPDLNAIAMEIDRRLRESPAVPSLAADPRVPRITRFEPRTAVVRPGERTDLEIEVRDDYPPLEYLLRAEHGSCNLDPTQSRWYFRAGPVKSKAEVALTVVNQINLMAEMRRLITIE
jgi:hypothetical protein